MREQPTRVKTGAVRRKILFAAAIASVIFTVAAVLFILLMPAAYVPPPYEVNAIVGIPEPPENLRHSNVNAFGYFTFGIAGALRRAEDDDLQIYLSNLEDNEFYLMCEITDTYGNLLYRSGLLRPGEYVRSLSPLADLREEGFLVHINVKALDMEEFFSVGAMTLVNFLLPHEE